MIKLASFALAGALGVAAIALQPAAACPTVGVVGTDAVGYFPYRHRPYYVHERFARRFDRFDRFHHRWY